MDKTLMELRTPNVVRVYSEVVKCRIGNDLGVDKDALVLYTKDIVNMLSQIQTSDGWVNLEAANWRKDGEQWTPYLQVVEMLILLGMKLNVVEICSATLGEGTALKIHNVYEHKGKYYRRADVFYNVFEFMDFCNKWKLTPDNSETELFEDEEGVGNIIYWNKLKTEVNDD